MPGVFPGDPQRPGSVVGEPDFEGARGGGTAVRGVQSGDR